MITPTARATDTHAAQRIKRRISVVQLCSSSIKLCQALVALQLHSPTAPRKKKKECQRPRDEARLLLSVSPREENEGVVDDSGRYIERRELQTAIPCASQLIETGNIEEQTPAVVIESRSNDDQSVHARSS
jgi:hypothetical protein